ncbi:MAG TPA: hypothetical protein VNE59_14435 [Burkholderiales bacterium]|nr:hypothetical protein [Burkholderiales bacterium]
MLEWTRKDDGHPDHPMSDPASAAKLLAEMRGADPLAALEELRGRVDAVARAPSEDEKVRGEVLSLIHDASRAHMGALVAQFLALAAGKQAMPESSWSALDNFLRALTGALCASARVLLKQAATNPELQLAAAAGAAGGLHACRTLAKLCLLRYLSVPPKLWRLAYAVHGEAEKADCAATPVRIYPGQKTSTTATQELLRLLMLQASAPELMAPEQIELADRVLEELGGEFTLRPRGAADSVFCFDPESDQPPRRAIAGTAEPGTEARYFGVGMALDTLERLHKQLATARSADVKAFGKDIAPHAQLSAILHLLSFWGERSPYSPPERSSATGTLRVIAGYGPIWQHLSSAQTASSELTLVEDGDGAPAAPEAWVLKDVGGSELGADIPKPASDWVQCGEVVAVSMEGSDAWWLGVIRSLHAESGRGLHGKIFIVSREPKALQLLPQLEAGEEDVYTGEAARQFNFRRARAIVVSDGSAGTQTANFLLAPESWKAGRVYEATLEGATRYLRAVQLLRQRDDYVRATFEWVAQS